MSAAVSTRPSFVAVVRAIAGRGLLRMARVPTLLLPAVIMPVFFVVAFSGSFASAVEIEGYGTDKAVNWMTAWAALQGSAFAGVGAAGAAATDLENGFFDRLRAAPISPSAIVTGLITYSVTRAVVPVTAVLIVSLGLLGADLPGGLLGLLMVYVAALGLSAVIGLFALGIVFSFGTLRSLALVQLTMFGVMFLSIGQAPLAAMEGWLHDVAAINPITNIIRLCRQGFLGEVTWSTTWPGLVALAAMLVGTGAFSRWRYRTVDQ